MTILQKALLRSADEMLAMLMAVDRWPGVMNVLYPKILESADRVLNSHGIVFCLLEAFDAVDGKYDANVTLPLRMMAPQFIDAMVADADVAAEAKAWYDEMMADFEAQKMSA